MEINKDLTIPTNIGLDIPLECITNYVHRRINTEQWVGFTYNGKKLYRKIINTQTPTSSQGTLDVNLGSNINVHEFNGVVYSNYTGLRLPANYWWNDGDAIMLYYSAEGNFAMKIEAERYRGLPIELTVYYSKTDE